VLKTLLKVSQETNLAGLETIRGCIILIWQVSSKPVILTTEPLSKTHPVGISKPAFSKILFTVQVS
jgi:hypothetical protein